MDKESNQNEQAALLAMIEQTALAHAADLARSGRLAEAEASLQETVRDRATPALLDLLARIHAQQRHWKEAEDTWTRALQLDSGNKAYTAGLQAVARMRRWPVFPRLIWLIVVILALLLAGILAGRSIYRASQPVATPSLPSAVPSQTSTLPPTATSTPAPSATPTVVPTPTATPVSCTVIPNVLNGALNVRQGPNYYFPVIGSLAGGEQVVILGDPMVQTTTGWLYIYRAPDLTGWINAAFCEP